MFFVQGRFITSGTSQSEELKAHKYRNTQQDRKDSATKISLPSIFLLFFKGGMKDQSTERMTDPSFLLLAGMYHTKTDCRLKRGRNQIWHAFVHAVRAADILPQRTIFLTMHIYRFDTYHMASCVHHHLSAIHARYSLHD